MVSDCYPAHLKVVTLDKRICLAHLLRECAGLHEKYHSKWALLLKAKPEHIIKLLKQKNIPQNSRL